MQLVAETIKILFCLCAFQYQHHTDSHMLVTMDQVLNPSYWFHVVDISTWMSKTSWTWHMKLSIVLPTKAALCVASYNSADGNCILLTAQPQILGGADCYCSLTSSQSENQSWFNLHSKYRVWSFLSTCTITTMIWAAIIFCLNWSKSLLTGLSSPLPPKSKFSAQQPENAFSV